MIVCRSVYSVGLLDKNSSRGESTQCVIELGIRSSGPGT